jgi:predicted AlkP superfamily pyrophosphatase or phosphodiesterase
VPPDRTLIPLWLVVAACAAPMPAADVVPTAPQTVVLVSIDGFRWDYIRHAEAAAIRAIAAQGVRATHMEAVFPTKTFPNHYSQVTGLYPESHGVVGNSMEDATLGWFAMGDTVSLRNPAWWGGEPIWVTAERQGRRAASFFWPGSEAAIGGVRPTWFRRYDTAVPHDVRVRQVLDWLALPPDSAPAMITLYFSLVDWAGHRFGPDAPETRAAIARVDSAVGALWSGIAALDLRDRVNLILVSDHGMAAVSRDRVILLDDWLASGTYRVVEWNPVALIVPAEGREAEVLERLRRIPNLTTYRKDEVPARLRFRRHPRITPLVAIADEGWSIGTRDRFESNPTFAVGGTHGYDNALESMGALFLAAGPAFAVGRVVPRVRAVDLYELMAHVLHLRPAPNDGALDSIRVVVK